MTGAPASYVDPRGPTLAAALVFAFIVYSMRSESAVDAGSLPWTIDPTGMLNDSKVYVGLYIATIPAKEVLNLILKFLGGALIGYKRMDEGDDGRTRKLEVLELHDLSYLALNTLVEFLGMNHIAAFLISDHVVYELKDFSVFNGPAAFALLFLINDVVYYPFHLVAHRRALYPYCHKQHHRQFVPFRGYADAANQHPLEQVYGFSIFIASAWLTSQLLGLHAATAWLSMLGWAILNICNHLAFDTRIHLPILYPALPRDHNTHHRFPNTNYSTLTSLMDRMFGTYRPYEAIGHRSSKAVTAKKFSKRHEAIPSPKSIFCFGFLLVLALIAVDVYNHRGLVPDWHELTVITKSLIVIANVGLLCSAFDEGDGNSELSEEERWKLEQPSRTFNFRGERKGEALPAGFMKRWASGKTEAGSYAFGKDDVRMRKVQ